MGFRDAWSVAVFDHYVLAVWVGNFDGRRNAAFVGRTCAGPAPLPNDRCHAPPGPRAPEAPLASARRQSAARGIMRSDGTASHRGLRASHHRMVHPGRFPDYH